MPLLDIRSATRADLPAIVAMLADDMRGHAREDASLPLDLAYEKALEVISADPNQLLVVALIKSEIVGTLQITFIPGLSYKGAWIGQIEAVRIASKLRGLGHGSELIRWAIDACRDRGCHLVQLSSNAERVDSHRFYSKLGFAQSHLGFKLTL